MRKAEWVLACIIAPTIPVVVIDAPGTGATLTGPGEVESSGNSENALGIRVWLMEMDLGSSGGERRRVTSSATRFTSCFDKSGGRERVCGSTEAALELGEDLSVSLRGDEIWFSRVGCEPARLVFLRGCSPPGCNCNRLC